MEIAGRWSSVAESLRNTFEEHNRTVALYREALRGVAESMLELGRTAGAFREEFAKAMQSVVLAPEIAEALQDAIRRMSGIAVPLQVPPSARLVQDLADLTSNWDVSWKAFASRLAAAVESGAEFDVVTTAIEVSGAADPALPDGRRSDAIHIASIVITVILWLLGGLQDRANTAAITAKIDELIQVQREIAERSSGPGEVGPGTKLVPLRKVYLRQEPSSQSPIVNTIPGDRLLVVIKKNGRWLQVMPVPAGEAETEVGWVYKRYLRPESTNE